MQYADVVQPLEHRGVLDPHIGADQQILDHLLFGFDPSGGGEGGADVAGAHADPQQRQADFGFADLRRGDEAIDKVVADRWRQLARQRHRHFQMLVGGEPEAQTGPRPPVPFRWRGTGVVRSRPRIPSSQLPLGIKRERAAVRTVAALIQIKSLPA